MAQMKWNLMSGALWNVWYWWRLIGDSDNPLRFPFKASEGKQRSRLTFASGFRRRRCCFAWRRAGCRGCLRVRRGERESLRRKSRIFCKKAIDKFADHLRRHGNSLQVSPDLWWDASSGDGRDGMVFLVVIRRERIRRGFRHFLVNRDGRRCYCFILVNRRHESLEGSKKPEISRWTF